MSNNTSTETKNYSVVTNLQTQMLDIHKEGCRDAVKAKRHSEVDVVAATDIDDWTYDVFGEVEDIENPSDYQHYLPCAK